MTENKQFHYGEDTLLRHFGDPTGFSRVSNTLTRLYTQLEGFDITHVGLYSYLRSWRNTTDEKMKNIVWHSREYLQAQSSLGRTAFDSRLEILQKYGLVTIKKSDVVANKDYFIIHDPLYRDDFIEKYRTEVQDFLAKAFEIETKNAAFRYRKDMEMLEKMRSKGAQ